MSGTALSRTVDDFCKRNNCSYDMLAAKLDVSRATIFNWKRDTRGLPRIVLLALIALEEKLVLHPVNNSRSSPHANGDIRMRDVPSHIEIESFCKRNDYRYDLLSDELKVSRATIFNWKAAPETPRIALLALTALEEMPELRTVKKPSEAHSGRKQYRRGSVVKLKE